jgi:hypothetical protein
MSKRVHSRRHQWLKPVTLATEEAEIRRMKPVQAK